MVAYCPPKLMSGRPHKLRNGTKKHLSERQFFASLEVFVVFNSTKVNSRAKKQNKQDLFFILHKKNIKFHLVTLENELFEVA